MGYTRPLPKAQDLYQVSEAIKRYPINKDEIIEVVKSLGFADEIVDFLKLFSGRFESRADLYTRTTELALLIEAERGLQEEGQLSQQD